MKTVKIYRVASTGNNMPVCTAFRADQFFCRLRGLLGRAPLTRNQGLLITPCSQVHTVGMKYSLDIIFMDKTGRITKCVTNLKPNRIAASFKAHHTLEVCSGHINTHQIKVGDQLTWQTIA